MNYEKHLAELDKFRKVVTKLTSDLDGLGIELSDYMGQVVDMRDDYENKRQMTYPKNGGVSKPAEPKQYDKQGNRILPEGKKKRLQKIAGIL